MMTINDILKALECCSGYDPKCEDCPYCGIGMCESEIKEDALEYLKKLKRIEAKIEKIAIGNVEETLSKIDNSPLTWDELQTMVEKPVWLESHGDITEFTGWAIVSRALSDRAHFILSHYDDNFLTYEMALPDITFSRDWQVYRKERI